MAELESNPEYVKRRREREEELAHRRRFRERAEEPLVRDLRLAGCQVGSVWDLVGSNDDYLAAIPVLMEHMELEYPDRVREGIFRALAVPVLDLEDWNLLLTHFDQESREVKWAVALALAANAREANRDQLIKLVGDARHGKSRSVLAEVLWRFRDRRVDSLLTALESDPEIGPSVKRILEAGTALES